MRERLNRRLAASLGVVLALAAFTNDLLFTPPDFLERAVEVVLDADESSG